MFLAQATPSTDASGFFPSQGKGRVRTGDFKTLRKTIMAKLILTAAPTFKANVLIPVPGKKPVAVEFSFKGRTKDEFKTFIETMGDREDVDVILDIATGWELEDAFGKESVDMLLQNYIGSARVIIEKYLAELTAARLGN